MGTKKSSKKAKPAKPRKPKVLHGVLWYSVRRKAWLFEAMPTPADAEKLAANMNVWEPGNHPQAVKAVIL